MTETKEKTYSRNLYENFSDALDSEEDIDILVSLIMELSDVIDDEETDKDTAKIEQSVRKTEYNLLHLIITSLYRYADKELWTLTHIAKMASLYMTSPEDFKEAIVGTAVSHSDTDLVRAYYYLKGSGKILTMMCARSLALRINYFLYKQKFIKSQEHFYKSQELNRQLVKNSDALVKMCKELFGHMPGKTHD